MYPYQQNNFDPYSGIGFNPNVQISGSYAPQNQNHFGLSAPPLPHIPNIPGTSSYTSTPSTYPIPGTPNTYHITGTPSAFPSAGTPSIFPTPGYPSIHPTPGYPSNYPATGTPSTHPTTGTPSTHPATGTPSSHPTTNLNAPLPDPELNGRLNALRIEVSKTGQLYSDPEFIAGNSSLFPTKAFSKTIIWRRPHEIVQNPKFIVDGVSRFDVRQGELGDCWLLAAVSNLTLHPSLFNNIVCPGQNFDQNYSGFFYFRFWRFGKWVDVVVDDKLPTINGKLAFLHSADGNEFWSALLEKAYAKLHGSYEGLSGGRPCTAMDDFTGGVSEIFDLKEDVAPNLFEIMLKGYERGSLMACSIEPNPTVVEQRLNNGLVKGHAYSITSVKECEVSSPHGRYRAPLVRIRNPWGNETEWTGSWSDKSQEWNYVSPAERQNLGLTFDADGEFWMSFQDFSTNFDAVEMTNVNLESLTEKDMHNHVKHKWEVKKFDGSWVKGATAGGCANYPNTFWNNPKYYVTLKEEDDGDKDMKCTMIVALLQKPRSGTKGSTKFLTIGFSVHPVPANIVSGGVINDGVLRKTLEIKGLSHYANHRQMSHRFNLQPGTYCIIPTTYQPDEEASFMLRVFCEKPSDLKEVSNPVGFVGPNPKVIAPSGQSTENEVDAQMRFVFQKIAGPDNQIDWKELQNLLNKRFESQFRFEGFSKSACRSMVAMLDSDKSGMLEFQEFLHLWNIITIWKKAFEHHDKDSSGKLSGYEFRDALLTSGFQISNNLFISLLTIYGDENKDITFDDFVLASIRLSKSFRTFNEKDLTKKGSATFSLEEYMEQTLCM